MSKPVKDLIKKELQKRFDGVTSLAIVGFTGLDGVTTHAIRGRLRQKDIHITVVKNSIARQAFREMGLEPAAKALEGPCAIVYGADNVVSIVRELLDVQKEAKSLTVKAALLEGEIFGADRIQELSKYPTRAEAVGRVVGCILSPGGKLAACLAGPGSRIASLLKAIEEKRLKEGQGAPAPEAA